MHVPLGFIKRNVELGAHIVLLYEKESELLEIFPPFFAAGLKNNELCIVVYPSLKLKQKIEKKLSRLVNLKNYIKENKIEFVHYKKFYFKNNVFSEEKVLASRMLMEYEEQGTCPGLLTNRLKKSLFMKKTLLKNTTKRICC